MTEDHTLNLRKRLSAGVIVSFFVRSSAIGLSLAVSIALARLLGPESYGVFTYAVTIASLLFIPAVLGFPQLLVRLTASYRQSDRWGELRGLLQFAPAAVFAASAVLALCGAGALLVWPGLVSEARVDIFYLALLVVPVMALTSIVSSVVRGLHKVILAQLAELIIRPLIFLVLIVSVAWGLELSLGPDMAIALYLVSWLVAFLFCVFFMMRNLPWQRLAVKAVYPLPTWVRSAGPLLLSGGMFFLHSRTDILMIGIFDPPDQVGIYQVASKGSGVLLFFLTLNAAVIAPYLSSLYSAGKNEVMQKVLSYSTGLAFAATLPALLILVLFGDHILQFVFGQPYVPAYTAMAILAVGYFFSVSMGSCGLVLNMTGFETKGAIGLGISSVANVLLNLLLIPRFGIEGAAIATCLSIFLWNILLVCFVWQSTRLDTTIIGFFRQPVLRELRLRQ